MLSLKCNHIEVYNYLGVVQNKQGKLIEAEEEKNKPPEGDFECPDGTKVFDLTNCPDGGGPVEKARAEAAKKLKDAEDKKRKADAEKREKDSVKEMEDALKELEKA